MEVHILIWFNTFGALHKGQRGLRSKGEKKKIQGVYSSDYLVEGTSQKSISDRRPIPKIPFKNSGNVDPRNSKKNNSCGPSNI